MKSLKLGMLGLATMFGAMLSVSATTCTTNSQGAVASITKDSQTQYCTNVKDAVDDADANTTVILLDNYTFTGTADNDRIKISKNLTFDFGKYTITIDQLPANYGGIVVTGTSTEVTFVGTGGIARTNGSAALLVTSGANVTINGGTFTQSGNSDDQKSHSVIDVVDSKLTVEEKNDDKIIITGGITLGGTNPELTVKSGEITDDSFAISGIGNATTNSTINIMGGKIESTANAAIYQPNSGTLNITGGDIIGKIGIVARGGQVNVSEDAHIVAKGSTDETITTGDAKADGELVELPTGVGIVIDNTESYPDTTHVKATVTGGNFETDVAAVEAYKNEEETATDLIEIKGGKFDKEIDTKYLTTGVERSESGVVGKLHNITFDENENGTIDVPSNAAEGEEVTITVTANENFKVSKVYVNGKEITANEDGIYAFTMGEEDARITAEFISIEASSSIPTTPEPEAENPSTLDNVPLYLSLGTIALTGVTALGYSLRKKFEN